VFYALSFAICIDYIVGWPNRFVDLIGHPVIFIGKAISWFEKYFNSGSKIRKIICGGFSTLLLIAVFYLVAYYIELYIVTHTSGWITLIILAIFIWPWLAIKSMHIHISNILAPLSNGDIEKARYELSMIVGRSTGTLDENEISRSAIESLAENTSDGVIAPLFWCVALGLPGLVAYKVINTADSMIAYKSERFKDYGLVAAKIDDIVNYIPARVTAVLYSFVGFAPTKLWGLRLEVKFHRSPNAGWPEGIVARILNVKLSGPRIYNNRLSTDAWLNADAPDATSSSVQEALKLFNKVIVILIFIFFLMGLVFK
jgi:adenosylcobinamide-phosphate synthase